MCKHLPSMIASSSLSGTSTLLLHWLEDCTRGVLDTRRDESHFVWKHAYNLPRPSLTHAQRKSGHLTSLTAQRHPCAVRVAFRVAGTTSAIAERVPHHATHSPQSPGRARNMAGSKRLRGPPALPAKKEGQSTTTTKSSKKKAYSTSSKLLELPPELRDKIFRYALVSNEPTKLQFSSSCWPSRRRRFTMIPGLINTSKQLRSETQRMFFEENTFEITPEVMKQRSGAPVILLRTMHYNLGLQLDP